jgi:hypothetical protein
MGVGAEIPDGAVLVARAILNSSLWTMRPEDCKVAVTCIALCNWKPAKWFDGRREVVIGRGQFVRSLKDMAEAAHLSLQTVRTSLRNLESTGFLTRKSTSRYTIISVPKYEFYQDLSKYSDSANTRANTRPTRGQHAVNKPPTNGQHRANNKQEGDKGEEGKEGEEGEEKKRPGDSGRPSAGLVRAFAFCKSPGPKAKADALDDLLRQGVAYERIMASATDPANRNSDFYDIVRDLKPKKGGTNGRQQGASAPRDFALTDDDIERFSSGRGGRGEPGEQNKA